MFIQWKEYSGQSSLWRNPLQLDHGRDGHYGQDGHQRQRCQDGHHAGVYIIPKNWVFYKMDPVFFIKSAKNGSFFININIGINGRIYTPGVSLLEGEGEGLDPWTGWKVKHSQCITTQCIESLHLWPLQHIRVPCHEMRAGTGTWRSATAKSYPVILSLSPWSRRT